IVIKTAIAAALWFIAVVWLAFPGPEISYLRVIVTLFFVMFFVLFLLTVFYCVAALAFAYAALTRIPRQRDQHRRRQDERTRRSHRNETAVIPVSLAFAATLIGLAWVIFG